MLHCIGFRIFCSALLFLVLSSKVSAQQAPETASVCGIVQDGTGAGIPGVLAELSIRYQNQSWRPVLFSRRGQADGFETDHRKLAVHPSEALRSKAPIFVVRCEKYSSIGSWRIRFQFDTEYPA
jgi:hypothetical protein